MSFLSPSYFLFFPITVLGYWALPQKARNGWLLGCSWFFYLCAGPRYFPLLIAVCAVSYVTALALEKRRRKGLLAGALCLFVGLLFLFKYLNFGVDTLSRLLALAGLDWTPMVPKLLLPAGISFYLFTAMGYLMDVYRGKVPAEKNGLKCALFLSFFPSLLSGPIGRAERLLPQFSRLHKFNYVNLREGLFRFLWGAFKKLVLADRLAVVVDTVFAAPQNYGAIQVVIAACAFSVQIYCDFSAYSDMAVGSAKVMGFELMENFRTPYFSKSIAEFWRRWHISLSTWFRDYLYIPLGGSRRGTVRKYVNVLIVFAVSGLWHGAGWNFVVWGALNGLYQAAGDLTLPVRTRLQQRLHIRTQCGSYRLLQGIITFGLVDFTWLFFRAESFTTALRMLWHGINNIGLFSFFNPDTLLGIQTMALSEKNFFVMLLGLAVLLLVDYKKKQNVDFKGTLARQNIWFRWLVYYGLIFVVLIFGIYGPEYDASTFIYFQF